MTQKPDGGPAFAAAWGSPEQGGDYVPGMSLRDYFAGQALVGLLAGRGGPLQRKFMSDEATLVYDYADAMIAARDAT